MNAGSRRDCEKDRGARRRGEQMKGIRPTAAMHTRGTLAELFGSPNCYGNDYDPVSKKCPRLGIGPIASAIALGRPLIHDFGRDVSGRVDRGERIGEARDGGAAVGASSGQG